MNANIHTVSKIERHDVVHSVPFVHEFADMHSREWTKQALIILEEAAKACMVEIIAESHCYKQ